MSHRNRDGKIMTKHTILKGLKPVLDRIAEWDEVETITPGKISWAGHTPKRGVYFQYRTATGLKCVGRFESGAQEIFIVTSHPDLIEERIKEEIEGEKPQAGSRKRAKAKQHRPKVLDRPQKGDSYTWTERRDPSTWMQRSTNTIGEILRSKGEIS